MLGYTYTACLILGYVLGPLVIGTWLSEATCSFEMRPALAAFLDLWTVEGESSVFLRNVSHGLDNGAASHPGKTE